MPYKLAPPALPDSPHYRVSGTEHGVRINRSTQTASKSEALRFLAKWRADAQHHALSDRSTKPLTFSGAATAYLNSGGEAQFLRPLVLQFGEKPIASITQADIDNAAVALYPAAGAPTRNRAVYTPISAIMRHAGITLALRRPKGSLGPPRSHWLRPEQAFALLASAREINERFGAMLTFLLYTGCRLSDALRLEWPDVDFARGVALLRDTKNGTSITVHMTPEIVAALANLPRGRRVFAMSKCGRIYTWLAEAEKRAGLALPPRSAFHILRHTHAVYRRLYTGADTSALVATGLWKSRNAAAVYEHIDTSEEMRKADLLPTAGRMK